MDDSSWSSWGGSISNLSLASSVAMTNSNVFNLRQKIIVQLIGRQKTVLIEQNIVNRGEWL